MKRLFLLVLVVMSFQAKAVIWEYGFFNPKAKECRLTGWHGTQPSTGILKVPSTMTHSDGNEYKIVSIGEHALDNFTTVKEIHISQYVDSIGRANTTTFPIRVRNFGNCPMLEKFVVETANPYFSSSGAGMLLMENRVLAVPAKMATGNGTFTVPKNIEAIEEYAFSQNTTIKILTLYANLEIDRNGGLNDMAQLESIRISGTGRLSIVDETLIDTDKYGRAVALPRKSKQEKVTLSSNVKSIEEYAFYRCSNLKRVISESVQEIGDCAFSFTGMTSMIFPFSMGKFGKAILEGCNNLQYIRFDTYETELPANFARDCPELKEVEAVGDIKKMGKAAFKNCSKLSKFPFSGNTEWFGDSSLYGCALKEIIFNKSPYPHSWHGEYQFAGNKELKIIDASSLFNTINDPFLLWYNMAPSCLKLTTLKLPEFTAYSKPSTLKEDVPFGTSCMLQRIEAHTIWGISTNSQGEKRQELRFYYSPGTTRYYSPDMFIAVTANRRISKDKYNEWGLQGMFQGVNGAVVTPNVYVDSREPSDLYEDANISYYIPGGCLSNYASAVSVGASVKEMYGITMAQDGDKMLVRAWNETGTVNGKSFRIDCIYFDNQGVTPDVNGYSRSYKDFSTISEVTVTYKVDGVKMETNYPKETWDLSGVDVPESEGFRLKRSGDIIHFEGNTSDFEYRLIDLKGKLLMKGNESTIDISSLQSGVYILECLSSGERKMKKILK